MAACSRELSWAVLSGDWCSRPCLLHTRFIRYRQGRLARESPKKGSPLVGSLAKQTAGAADMAIIHKDSSHAAGTGTTLLCSVLLTLCALLPTSHEWCETPESVPAQPQVEGMLAKHRKASCVVSVFKVRKQVRAGAERAENHRQAVCSIAA